MAAEARVLPWIDWSVAESVATRLIAAGPHSSQQERQDCVRDLRQGAAMAPALIAQAAQLPQPAERGVDLVVSRRAWVSAAVSEAKGLLAVVDAGAPAPHLGEVVKGRAIGLQIGLALSVFGTRVLGQYLPFGDERWLVLVAPNVMHVERLMQVPERDFRLWVCLHEQTHRVQFASAPWLSEHILGLAAKALTAESEAGDTITSAMIRLIRDGSTDRPAHLIDKLASPSARDAIDEVTAVMSLLEGHADVMMDRAGPEVIPSLALIRGKFERRRDVGLQGISGAIGKALGMDAKLAQYRNGANFCRAVIEKIGVCGLNQVWAGPTKLPTSVEILEPHRWLARMERESRTTAAG